MHSALSRIAIVQPWQRGHWWLSPDTQSSGPHYPLGSILQRLHGVGCGESVSIRCQVKRKRHAQMVPNGYVSNYEQIFLEVTLLFRHLTPGLSHLLSGLM